MQLRELLTTTIRNVPKITIKNGITTYQAAISRSPRKGQMIFAIIGKKMFWSKTLSQFQNKKKNSKKYIRKKKESKIKNFTKTKMGASKAKKIRGDEHGEIDVFLKY